MRTMPMRTWKGPNPSAGVGTLRENRRIIDLMRRIVALVFLGLTAISFGQAFDAEKKALVLNKVKENLTELAFVPGVNFDKWDEFVEARRADLDAAEDKRRFVFLINRTLREFGVSHISVTFARPAPAAGGLAWQEPPRQTPTSPSPPQIPFIELSWVDDKTAHLRLRTFADRYKPKEVEEKFAEINAKAEALILDLRGNGGGAVTNLQHFMSHLLPPRTEIGTMVSRRLAKAFAEATKGDATNGLEIAKWTDRRFRTSSLRTEPFKGKVAVLINRASASASEICAAALSEHKQAPLIGARSAGAVLVSRVVKLPEELEMKVPISDFYTWKFRRLEGNPLVPDHEVATRDTEACLAKAKEVLAADEGRERSRALSSRP